MPEATRSRSEVAPARELELGLPGRGDWRADLVEWARRLRVLYRRHPWLLDLAQGQLPMTPRSVAFLEAALATLAEVPAPGGTKMEAVALTVGLAVQLTRLELSAGRSSEAWQAAQVEYLTTVVADGRHPHLAAAVVAEPAGGSEEGMLERILPRVLAGLLEAPAAD